MARVKTFTNGGTLTAADLNAIQDDYDSRITAGFAVGDMKATALSIAPSGWLLCDGIAVTVASGYIALRNALLADGSKHGTDGSGNPRVPNLLGRVPIGAGTATGAAGATAHALGAVGGEETHQLLIAEMPAHTHEAAKTAFQAAAGSGVQIPWATGSSLVTSSTGGDGAHNNLQPYVAVNWIIKF